MPSSGLFTVDPLPLHSQFGEFTLYEAFNCPNRIVKDAEITKMWPFAY